MLNAQSVAMEATDELSMLMREYKKAKDAVKAAEERRDALKGVLKSVLEPSLSDETTEVALIDGDLKVTLKAVTSMRLDTTRIKNERPDIYHAYAKESTSYVLTDGLS